MKLTLVLIFFLNIQKCKLFCETFNLKHEAWCSNVGTPQDVPRLDEVGGVHGG